MNDRTVNPAPFNDRAFLAAGLGAFLFGASTFTEAPQAQGATEPIWPTKEWQTSSPEEQGIDSRELAKLVDFGATGSLDSLLVVRHGKIVVEAYYAPYDAGIPHQMYSATKAIVSTLTAIARKDGLLDSPDHRVLDFFDRRSIANVDDRKEAITVQNLLYMTSGIEWKQPLGGWPETMFEMERSPNWVKFVLDRPMANAPGEIFNYSNGNAHVVSAIITRLTGISALEYAKAKLFGPLGIKDLFWQHDPQGISYGGGGLYLQPRDMAKLGYLWLHNGRWEDRQVIPGDYLAQALTRHISVQPGIDYGYGMWLYPGHTPVDFEANGTGGQRITVIPGLDMVEVTTGNGLDANDVAQLIAGAAKSNEPLPPNPQADARLARLVASVASGPVAPANMQPREFVPVPRPKPIVVHHTLPDTLVVDRSIVPMPRLKPGAVHLSPAQAVVEKPAPAKATAADLAPAVPPPPATTAPAVAIAAKS